VKFKSKELHVTKETFLAVIIFIFSIILFSATYSMKTMALASIGPAFVPRLIAVLMCALSVIEIGSSLFRSIEASTETEEERKGVKKYSDILSIVIIFFYILILKRLGFILSSSLFLFFQIWLIQGKVKKRKLITFAIVSICLASCIYLLFVKGFSLILPVGILG
jgi:hypothetical protein